MTLKKIYGKSVGEARDEARRRYGDHVVVLETYTADESGQTGVTVMVDRPVREHTPPEEPSTAFRNVFYKRSDIARTQPIVEQDSVKQSTEEDSSGVQSPAQPQGTAFNPTQRTSTRLSNLRTYAMQTNGRAEERGISTNEIDFAQKTSRTPVADELLSGSSEHVNEVAGNETFAVRSLKQNGSADARTTVPTADRLTGQAASTRNTPQLDAIRNSQDDQARKEIAALHKRFDRLEKLLDSGLPASDLNMVAHPAFQQLIAGGIRPESVASWFRNIQRRGIDPETRPEQFMHELSVTIRKALSRNADKAVARIQLFTGSSGSGKTALVMKLALRSHQSGQSTAVVDLVPEQEEPYYSVLQPFASDHGIHCLRVPVGTTYADLADQLDAFDRVYVDTPSLDVRKDNAYRFIWELRENWKEPELETNTVALQQNDFMEYDPLSNGGYNRKTARAVARPGTGTTIESEPADEDDLAPGSFMELHYVASAGNGGSGLAAAVRNHHAIRPDMVCVTHLDEVTRWGPLVPFLSDMDAPCRYLTNSPSVASGLIAYDAAALAKRILHNPS